MKNLTDKKAGMKNMEEIISVNTVYTIIRDKGNGKEYFAGISMYGRDKEGILRVARPHWENSFSPAFLYDFERAEDILKAMKKYEETEKGYSYFIAKIQITNTIIDCVRVKLFDENV